MEQRLLVHSRPQPFDPIRIFAQGYRREQLSHGLGHQCAGAAATVAETDPAVTVVCRDFNQCVVARDYPARCERRRMVERHAHCARTYRGDRHYLRFPD